MSLLEVTEDALELSCTVTDDHAVVRASGELDVNTSQRLRRMITELLRQPVARISIDLGAITFMDSAGLRALLAHHVTTERAGVELRVVDPSQQVARVLELTGTYERLVGEPLQR